MGKMPLYTMLQKARSAGGWTMVAQLEGDAAGSQLLLLEGRPVWQRGDSTVLLQHLTELQGCTAAGIHSVAGTDIFAERFGAVPQLVVCGGGHVAAAVVQLAKLLGLTVLAMDDREEYAQLPRLAGVLLRWNLSALVRSVLVFFGASLLVYSVAALIGLRSTRAMLLLARALYLLEIPFFGFLLDCKVTTAQCTIIAFLYDCCRDCPPEALPEGKPHRFGGWPLLTAAVAGVTLATGLMAVYLYALPQDDALLTAVGGVTPLVTFHRGDCTVAPENTLPAFRSAILKGGDRIELDVQMTSDGVVVVTHDSNLKRCTGKNAKVYDLTYAEVAQLDAGRWFSSRFADTRIPTLEQVLQLCRGRIGLNVEIKPSAATPALEAETVRLLREYGFDSSNCVITSQSYETLHKVKALAPEYPTGYILALGVGNYYDLPDADFFSVETTFITSGMVNAVHLRGKTVSAWTIDREKVATHMLELGVDDLITDKPDMVQDLLARNQQVDDSLIDFRDLLNALLHPEQPADSSDDAEETITDAVEDPEEFVDAA